MAKAEEKQAVTKKYSKTAFLEAAVDGKERLMLGVLLTDGKSYTKEEVELKLSDWKKKEVKA